VDESAEVVAGERAEGPEGGEDKEVFHFVPSREPRAAAAVPAAMLARM
jgi:hypothetical protein